MKKVYCVVSDCCSRFKSHASRIAAVTLAAALGFMALFTAHPAFAVLTAEQQAVTDGVDTLIGDLGAWGWTVVLAMLGFTIGYKLVKKFGNAAI